MIKRYRSLLCLIFIPLFAGCGARSTLAPVSEVKWRPFSKYEKTHVVRRGETLYAIAFLYDTDYRSLASLNHIRPPYTLRIGQVLSLRGLVKPKPTTRNKSASATTSRHKVIHSPNHQSISSSGWLWPVRGQVVTGFTPQQGRKGINIASKKGERVLASSGGIVAYAGNGLEGYGNLIIIKHNNQYLTAYGNNARNLVTEGQRVKKGQVIAVVGVIEHKYRGVHFEIRKRGKPVNPLNYLQKG